MSEKFRAENREFFHEARSTLAACLEDSFFDDYRDQIRGAFMDCYKRLRKYVPANEIEMGELCSMIEESLRPAILRASEIDDSDEKARVKGVLDDIYNFRKSCRRQIVKYMKSEKLWQSSDCGARDLNIDYARGIISAYLGLNHTGSDPDSSEFQDEKALVLSLTCEEIRNFYGLDFLFRDVPGRQRIKSIAEFLDLVFPEYEFGDELDKKSRELKWVGQYLVKNVTSAANRCFGVPLKVPERDTKEWHEARERILNIGYADFFSPEEMNCGPSVNNHPRKYADVLAEVFGEDYDLTDELLSRRQQPRIYRWRSKEEALANTVDALGECDLGEDMAGTTQWWEQIYGLVITVKEARETYRLLGGFYRNEHFDSHIDLIIAAYPHVGLQRWHFSRLGRRLIKMRVEGGIDFAPTVDDISMIECIKNPDSDIYALIREQFETHRSKVTTLIDNEIYFRIKINIFIGHVRRMGKLTPVDLTRLWQATCRQVFSLVQGRVQRHGGDVSDLLPQEPAAE